MKDFFESFDKLCDQHNMPRFGTKEFNNLCQEYFSGIKTEEEKTYPFTAFHLQKELGWERFCELTGISYYAKNEGFEIKDSEVFNIKESDVKRYGLI